MPEGSAESASAAEVTVGDPQHPTSPLVQPTRFEREPGQVPVPASADGPPPPPWHPSVPSGSSAPTAGSNAVTPAELLFDPFEGTAFEPALGLAPPEITPQPISDQEAAGATNRGSPATAAVPSAEQVRPAAHSEDTRAKGWQAPPPASSWKRRN